MSFAFNPPHRPTPDEDVNFAPLDFGPPHADAGEHWLDEALRSVALPAGFLSRMAELGRLAEPAEDELQVADSTRNRRERPRNFVGRGSSPSSGGPPTHF